MKASELIGSNVLVLADAAICGTVANLLFADKLKKVTFLEVFIDDEDDCEIKYIAAKDVFATEENMISVKYPGALSAARPLAMRCPINLPAYDETGKALGYVTDIELDGWLVTSLVTAQKAYAPTEVLSRSEALIIMKKEGSTTKLGAPKRKMPKIKPAKLEERKVVVTALAFPAPKPNDYSFLYGRRAAQNISTFDGRLIIPSGTLVTPDLVSIAKRSGVIAQLAMFTSIAN